MALLDSYEPVHRFAIVPWFPSDLGPVPDLQQVVVTDGTGKHPITSDRIRVFGRLHVGVGVEDGIITSLYTLPVDYVEVVGGRVSWWPPTVVGGAALLVALTVMARGLAAATPAGGWVLHRVRVRPPGDTATVSGMWAVHVRRLSGRRITSRCCGPARVASSACRRRSNAWAATPGRRTRCRSSARPGAGRRRR